MTSSQTRFEKWAEEQGYDLEKRFPHGIYLFLETEGAWEAWKAAHESISAEIEKLTRFDMGTLTFYDESIETIVEDSLGDFILRNEVKDLLENTCIQESLPLE